MKANNNKVNWISWTYREKLRTIAGDGHGDLSLFDERQHMSMFKSMAHDGTRGNRIAIASQRHALRETVTFTQGDTLVLRLEDESKFMDHFNRRIEKMLG